MSPAEPEVVRYYTRARKFPHLVGRLPDGTRLPGGPYTLTQIIGAALVLTIGVKTMSIWGVFGGLVDVGLLLVGSIGALIGLERIRTGARSPVGALLGAYTAAAAPRFGRLNGRTLTRPRVRRLEHRVVFRTMGLPQARTAHEVEVAQPEPATYARARPATGLTGMQEALARASQSRGVEKAAP